MHRRVAVLIGIVLTLLFSSMGHAFVRMSVDGVSLFWPNATTSLNLAVGCPSTPLPVWGPCWTDAAIDAANQWLHPTTAFHFTIQSPASPTADPCGIDDKRTIAFRYFICGGLDFGSMLAVTISYFNRATGEYVDADTIFSAGLTWSTYSGPLQTNAAGTRVYDFHRVATHELGHIVGLAHPDEFGQQVVALMNSTIGDIETPQADDRAGAQAIYPATASPPSQGRLENPPPNSPVSGISLISGWVCTANQITVLVDGTISLVVPYGSPRGDTESDMWQSEYWLWAAGQLEQSATRITPGDRVRGWRRIWTVNGDRLHLWH